MELMTAAEMQALDRYAIEQIGIPSLVLMENAGRAVADAARKHRQPRSRVVCVVGRGNNGGDGLVAARYLHLWGHTVTVVLVSDEHDLSPDAAANLRPVVNLNITVIKLEQETVKRVTRCLSTADVIVDAVFGTGIRGDVAGSGRLAVELINAAGGFVISVDLPSGLNADTGQSGCAVRADVTVTLGHWKRGLALYPGAELAGKVIVADIGLPRDNGFCEALLMDHRIVREWLPVRGKCAHKGDCGKVLVIGGSRGYSGAAVLAARSALRSGAGLCYLAGPRSLESVFETIVPEVITVPVAETESGTVSDRAISHILSVAEDCDVVAIGPGLGRNKWVESFISEVVAGVKCPLVIDADGLQAWEGKLDCMLNKGQVVITPHPGEMSRLLGRPTSGVVADMIGCASEAARLMSGTCLLKGAASVIAAHDLLAVSASGTSAMATAGMGDVLTGLVASLIGQGTPVARAAAAGAFIHGIAGRKAVRRYGSRGIVAGDVCGQLPAVIEMILK